MSLVTAPPGLYVPLDGSGDLPSVEVVEELSKLFTRFVEDALAIERALEYCLKGDPLRAPQLVRMPEGL